MIPPYKTNETSFIAELESLINKHSMENGSDTPDFILAAYMSQCLKAFNSAIANRESWYGRRSRPSQASISNYETAAVPPSTLDWVLDMIENERGHQEYVQHRTGGEIHTSESMVHLIRIRDILQNPITGEKAR